MTEPKQRKEKKSETLEVRIPYDTKQAFLTACRDHGTTASEVVRGSIQDYLVAREQPQTQAGANPDKAPDKARTLIAMIPQPIRKKRWLVAGAGAAGLALLAALPSAAGPDFASAFAKIDANHDNVLSLDEFRAAMGGDAHSDRKVVIEMRSKAADGKDAPSKSDKAETNRAETKEEAFAYVVGDGKDGGAQQNVVVKRVTVSKSGDGKAPAVIQMDDIAQMQFDRFDVNKDGKVTLAEYQAEQTRLLTNGFNRLDADKDGFVTETEYAKIAQPMIIKVEGDGTASAEVKQVEAKVDGMLSPETLKAEFARHDKNKDGKLSLQEYLE